ncbi:hypothetical protein Tco_0273523 [Tanacetum coccineum]
MGCLPRSACLGSLSLTQSPNSFVLGEGLEIWDNQLCRWVYEWLSSRFREMVQDKQKHDQRSSMSDGDACPKDVFGGNYSSTKQVNSIKQLLAYSLITWIEGPEDSGALSKKRKKPKSNRPPTETKESSPKPIEGFEQSHSVSSGTVPDPQDLESFRDKDSGGNIPPADMEPIHTPVADPSRTSAKYQVDKTQSTRLSDKEEVLAAGDDMDEVPKDDAEVRTPSPDPTQPEPSHVQKSASDSFSQSFSIELLRNNGNREATVSYADLKASIDRYYDENIAHKDQTNKLIEASVSSLDRSSTTISDLYKGLDVITRLLKDINTAMKDDPATNQKLNEATETFARISSNITEVLSLVKGFDFFALLSIVKSILDHALKNEEATTAWMKSSTNMAWNLSSRIFKHTPKIDKGKWIATESDDDPSKKQVKPSFIVRPDPDEPVRVEFMISGKIVYLTKQEIQDY